MHQRNAQKFSRFLLGFCISLPFFVLLYIGISTLAAETVAANPIPARPAQQTSPTVQFAASTFTADEDDGTVTINVSISVAPTEPVTVTYQATDGSATVGTDYAAASGQLIFPADISAVQSFTITIVNDNITEPDETVVLILQNPQNATLGSINVANLVIRNDDTPTATPGAATATPIYVDVYESNDDPARATTLTVGDTSFCSANNATLWPAGDVDFYRFWGQAETAYAIMIKNISLGLIPELTIYDPNLNGLASNLDFPDNSTTRASFVTNVTGYYYVRVVNESPQDPAGMTYCVEVSETALPTSTPVPTRVGAADSCEPNFDFERACLIAPNTETQFDFVPFEGNGPDNDYYKLRVKTGFFYTCETDNLSAYSDTNMILFDQGGNTLGGNDDKAPGDLGSQMTYYATYDGFLYILVGNYGTPEYEFSPLYTYSLICTADLATPTPPPAPTHVPAPVVNNPGPSVPASPTPRPTEEATEVPQPTLDPALLALLTPTATPFVQFVPIATPTSSAAQASAAELMLLLYYDANDNHTAELDEGIMDMAVSIYDGSTGDLLSFGSTNEVGAIRLEYAASGSVIQVSIPFLGITQTVPVGASEIVIRIAPSTLPINIP